MRLFVHCILVTVIVLFAATALAQGPYWYYAITPCRAVDTRLTGTNGAPKLSAGETRNFQIRGLCGVPLSAKAVSYNMAVVNPTAQTHLIVWASGQQRPVVSAVNVGMNDPPTANGGITALSTEALDLSVFNAYGDVEVIIDITGYFQ